jgi:hypothetical protein
LCVLNLKYAKQNEASVKLSATSYCTAFNFLASTIESTFKIVPISVNYTEGIVDCGSQFFHEAFAFQESWKNNNELKQASL